MRFSDLSQRAQIAAIRTAVTQLLAEYGHDDAQIELVAHAYNTTFRVRKEGLDVALRVNINQNRTAEEVKGEQAFIQHISDSGLVPVPTPQAIFSGKAAVHTTVKGFAEARTVAAYSWLPGRTCSHRDIHIYGEGAGRAMGHMHRLTAGWKLPDGTWRHDLVSPLSELEWKLQDTGICAEVFHECLALFGRLSSKPKQLIHFDLHRYNVKYFKGQLAVFDFDDCVFSWPIVDVAQTLFYMRSAEKHEVAEKNFWKGLGTSPKLLGVTDRELELLIAGRSLLLANDMLASKTAELIKVADRYVRITEKRLQHFVKTGKFDPLVAMLLDET